MNDFEQKHPLPRGKNGASLGAKTGQERARSLRLKKTLPVGIRIGFRSDGRPKPFLLRYGNPPKDEFFANEVDRNDAAERMAKLKESHGAQMFSFDPDEWRTYQAFKERVNASLAEVESIFLRYKRSSAVDVTEAVKRYRELRDGEGLAEDSVRHATTILGRFVAACGHLPLANVTADHVRTWLAGLKKAHGFNSTTLRHHRKEVNTFFARAIREKWVMENPCETVVPPKIASGEIQFLSLKDAFTFFQVNRDVNAIGKLAAEAFAGLRNSSAALLEKKEVDYEAHGIAIAKLKTTGKREYRDGFPSNLFAWLEHAKADRHWEISERNYDKLKGDAFTRAQIKNPGNVLRHSFGTHHLSAFRDGPRTAFLMTHRNVATLYRHYAGRGVGQIEAWGYFQITPASVQLSFEEFRKRLDTLWPTKTGIALSADSSAPPKP